jgi:hypothetical protein
MSRLHIDDELPELDEGQFTASDIYNTSSYDNEGNAVSTSRKMHEHGYVLQKYGEPDSGNIFTSMHRRQVLSKAIQAGELGDGNQEIVVDREVKGAPNGRDGSENFGEDSEHQEDWNFTYQNEEGEYIHKSEGGARFNFRTKEEAEDSSNLDAAAVFYSVVFDEGPLGITFVKQNNGKFVVTVVLDFSPGLGTVKKGDTIVAISKQVIDKRMKQTHLGDLIRNTERPMTVTFERKGNNNSDVKSVKISEDKDKDRQEKMYQREANEAYRSMHSTRAKAGTQIVFGVGWEPDDARKHCYMCEADFNFFRRRHHCRKCGKLVCNSCSKQRVLLRQTKQRQRACDVCVSPQSGSPSTGSIHTSGGLDGQKSEDNLQESLDAAEAAEIEASLQEEAREIEAIRLELIEEKQKNEKALEAQEAVIEATIQAKVQAKIDAAAKIVKDKEENAARYAVDQSKKRGVNTDPGMDPAAGVGFGGEIGVGGRPSGSDRRQADRRASRSMIVTTIEEGDESEEEEEQEQEQEEQEEEQEEQEEEEEEEQGQKPAKGLKRKGKEAAKGKKAREVNVDDEVEEQARMMLDDVSVAAAETGRGEVSGKHEGGTTDLGAAKVTDAKTPVKEEKDGKKVRPRSSSKAKKAAAKEKKEKKDEEARVKKEKKEEDARGKKEEATRVKARLEELKAKAQEATKAKQEAQEHAKAQEQAKAQEAAEAKARTKQAESKVRRPALGLDDSLRVPTRFYCSHLHRPHHRPHPNALLLAPLRTFLGEGRSKSAGKTREGG